MATTGGDGASKHGSSSERADSATGFRIPERVGSFAMLRVLGAGGTGVVCEAYDAEVNRRVAIKLLRSTLGDPARGIERLRREAEACASRRHEGIVTVHSFGMHEGAPYIVQELVEGGRTLAHLIADARAAQGITPDHYVRVAELVAVVAEALHFAHEGGVIHRDVKPSNILLTREGRPKLADFGIALLARAETLSATGEVLGTPFYMSPEQFRGERAAVTALSDVFSLGVTLYEALTLARAFHGDNHEQVRHRVTNEEPLDARKLAPRVPRDLAVICAKALEKEPSRRYASMREMAADLRRFLGNESIRAKPAGPLERARKWARRHPVAAVSIAGFAAVAVALVRERRASAREHASAERARFEADTAEETITLLTKLLTLADPESARDKPPTVREVVDRGAALVAGELQGNEALRARLLHVLGTVSSTIGANEQAERMLAEALPLRRELYGASDSRSLDTQIALASVVAVRGRPRDARAMFADAQEAQRLAPDPNDRRAADIEHGLGFVTFQLGELSEAIQHFRRAHELRRRAFGDDDRDARRSLSALAAALAQAGQLEQARDALEEVLRLDLASLGETSPTTLNAMMNLATTYTQLGDFAAAEELDRRVLAIQDRVLGPDHVERATTLLNLSGIVLRLGRSDEARALAHAALDIRCEHFAPDDPRIANVYTSLGYLDLERGALASAQAWFETAYANLLRQRGPGHFDTLSAANNLADVYQRTGRAAEAEALARTVLAERIKLDPGHRYRLLTETILARSLADLGRHQEARELLREVVSLTADPRELAERSSLLAELDRPRGSR